MDDNTVLSMLNAADTDIVLNGLFALGGQKDHRPPDAVLRRATNLFSHPDPDVRRQAIFAVAIHWGRTDAFPALVALLESEKDEAVADAAVAGVARLGREAPELVSQALSTLRRVFDVGHSEHVKAFAYIDARWMCGDTNAAEHARERLAPGRVLIDPTWFDNAVFHCGSKH